METSRQHPLNKTEKEDKKCRTGSGVCAMAGSGTGCDEVSGCNRTLLAQQTERLLESVAGSSVRSTLRLNRQRTFKKPLVINRRGCIQRGLNGENG
jgi:hypothetical protein